jgi:hypothetical protein
MKRSTGKYLFLWCVACVVATGVSRAGVVYSAPPNQSGGSDANGFLEADDIEIAVPTRLGIFNFWTFQTSAADYTGFIEWSLRSDSGGMPGASVISATTPATFVSTGKTAFGLSEFVYTFATDITVNPGRYWLVLHNGPNTAIPPTNFFWEWSNGNAGDSLSQDLALPNQPWLGNFAELALQVQDIPEPGSLLLSAVGLLGICLARCRK